MKKFLIVLAFPMSSYAICLNTVYITGYGPDKTKAALDAKVKADLACDAGDFNWSVKKSDFVYSDLTNGEERFFTAKAEYQCCGSW